MAVASFLFPLLLMAEETSPELGNLLPELHLLDPFYRNEIVYRESVVFVADGKNPPLGQLLFAPVRILAVESANRSQSFEEGKDFTVDSDGRGLRAIIGGRLPTIAEEELFPPSGAPRSLPAKGDDPKRNVLFDNEHWFHDQQVEVTYLRKPGDWQGPVPAFDASKLPKTLAKLKQRQPVTIGVSGDSISAGYNASAYSKSPPFMPPYPDLVAAELRYLFGGSVKLVNRAISGWSAANGLEDLDKLLQEKPDLILVAYGMNDVSGRDPETFGQRIGQMVRRIEEQLPEAEVLLIAPMLGNGQWRHTPTEMFPQYREKLASLVRPGVALVDMTSLWQAMMQRKRHVDLTGNGVNHPNDFGHRLYASAILSFFEDPESMAQARPAEAREAAKRFRVPPGFAANLFAHEPEVVQPIAFTFDDRGRMWVVECHSYPDWKSGKRDRVLILEDTNGDGVADSRQIFWEGGTNLTGIAYGFGGVWLCATPHLLFVPDADRDDIPDGPAAVKLDGWDLEARHNAFNGLAWGPDGWLYGCNGILSNSRIGPPGTPEDKRVAMNCGVWRYHPTDGRFEAVAHGTTNPWGLAFDDRGEMFITNCVIKHLFHVIPGAHYVRMFGQDILPRSYGLIESCADHIHWGGGHWTEARGGETHDSFGGGHAHSGAAIYLSDLFPKDYRGRIFMCNIHGNRLNQDRLERHGSGYVAQHEPDFFHAGDPWFRGIAVHAGPEGALYISDWSDTGECHNYVIADRSNGRIVRITYGSDIPRPTDLSTQTNFELIDQQLSGNDWQARTARRLLQERASRDRLTSEERSRLIEFLTSPTLPTENRLRALWTLFVTGELRDDGLLLGLRDPDEDVRAWSVRLAVEQAPSEEALREIQRLASDETSPRVQLALASALQRLSPAARWAVAGPLVERIGDETDHNLPWMLWYGIEPLVTNNADQGIDLARRAQLPNLRQSIFRTVASQAETEPTLWTKCFQLLASGSERQRLDYLLGWELALEGRRHLPPPPGWQEAYLTLAQGPSAVVDAATRIGLIFDDPQALKLLTGTAQDSNAAREKREEALAALIQARPAELIDLLEKTLEDSLLQTATLRGLATLEDSRIPDWILSRWSTYSPADRDAAIGTLTARSAWASKLLDAVEKGQVPANALSAFHIQQLLTLEDQGVLERVARRFGTVRPSSADRQTTMQLLRSRLTPEEIAKGDLSRGRAVFKKNCAACHKLFDDGGAVGPELTGAQRNNLDYVLQNVVDPSAIVPRDYKCNFS